jgi:hypothetical protein
MLVSKLNSQCWWLMPIILATWKTEIRKIKVRGQPGQTALKTPSLKTTRVK